MPNWVFNSLAIEGDKDSIRLVKSAVGKPFSKTGDSWNMKTGQLERVTLVYSNPVFSFHNIYNHKQDGLSVDEYLTDSRWYSWNVSHWGTKWDVAVADGYEYSDTCLVEESENDLSYRFNTAWGAPIPAIEKLSGQFPTLVFDLEYEEEQGWGGRVTIRAGKIVEEFVYDSKCNECGTEFLGDGLVWCDDCNDNVCSECNYGASDDCAIHKVKVGV